MLSSHNNLYFVNVAKTLGIFLMVLAHLSIPENLYVFINSFHMPLFFILSGYLLSAKTLSIPLKAFFAKKAKTLLIPYSIFVVITFLFWYFIGRKFGENMQPESNTVKYIIGAALAIPSKEFMEFNLPIWFLPSLFCSEIIFYLVHKYCKNYSFILFILIFGLGIFITENHFARLPYGLDVSLFSLVFIYFGYYLKEKNLIDKYIIHPSLLYKGITFIVFFALTVYISSINDTVLMYQCKMGNYLLFFIGAISGTIIILSVSSIIKEYPFFNFYGRNTIIILGFHLMTFSIIKGIQTFVLKIPLEITAGNLAVDILYSILVFLFLAPVIYLINKYIPFVLGRKSGIV